MTQINKNSIMVDATLHYHELMMWKEDPNEKLSRHIEAMTHQEHSYFIEGEYNRLLAEQYDKLLEEKLLERHSQQYPMANSSLPLLFKLKKRNGGYMNNYFYPPPYWGYSKYPNKKPTQSGYYKVILDNHSKLIETMDYYDVDKKEWSWYNKSTLATNIDCYSDRRLPIVMFDPTSLITINLPPLEDLKL